MWKKVISPILAAILLSAVFVFQARTPAATVAKAPAVTLASIGGYANDDAKYAEKQQVSEAEKKVLPKDTVIIKRVYVSDDGLEFLVSAVIGGTQRASIHRPELCLPSQGYAMSNPRNMTIGGRPWHFVDAEKHGIGKITISYTFVNQTGFRTASHTQRIFRDVFDRSVFNRVDRWVMISVHSSGASKADIEQFLGKIGEIVP